MMRRMCYLAFVVMVVVVAVAAAFQLGAQAGQTPSRKSPAPPWVVGVAVGFPPYQYQDARGASAGLDVEVARLVAAELGVDVRFEQRSWDTVYMELAHRTGLVDALCGAEVNDERRALFEFSVPYYTRAVAVFVRRDSTVAGLAGLKGKRVAADRGGTIQVLLEAAGARLVSTESKEASFKLLAAGSVEAAAAPVEVGRWFAREFKLNLRVLPERDAGSPVAFAVAKGNRAMAERINAALGRLSSDGRLAAVLKKYQ